MCLVRNGWGSESDTGGWTEKGKEKEWERGKDK